MNSSNPSYRRCERSVSFTKANLNGLIFGLLPALLLVIGYAVIHHNLTIVVTWKLLLVMVIGIVVHEALHAIGWLLAGRISLRALRIGFDVKTFTPFAHVSQPLPINAYRFGTLLPCIVLGIVPAIIGIMTRWPEATIFGALFTLAAGGDLLILWLLRRDSAEALVVDHPDRVGCEVWLPANNS